MRFLKNNLCTILMLTLVVTFAMMGDAEAQTTSSVFGTARSKLTDLFRNVKWVVFIIGGFGLVALAFQAIFGKLKWAWFAALAFGLAVVAAASGIITYANNNDMSQGSISGLNDTLK